MSQGILALLAVLPLAAIFILTVNLRWSATRAMPVAFGVTLILALVFWGTPLNWILAACVNGVMGMLKILLIVLGALILLFTLKESGALGVINHGFSTISPDRRIQTIIIAWMFGSFIEGASGFGVPGAIVAPLLLSLGFPALAAVIVGIIANTTCIPFGTVGTATLIGIGTTLNTPEVLTDLANSGMDYSSFIHQIGAWSAVLHALPGIFMPLIMVVTLTRFFGENRSFKEGLEIWPYAIFAGTCFVIPYVAVAILLSPEFPTLLGSLIGLLILIPLTKRGFLAPKKVWDFAGKDKWTSEWNSSITISETLTDKKISLAKAWAPYAFIVLILVITRVNFFPFGAWLKSIKLSIPQMFGTTVTSELDFLNNPGVFPFLPIALLCIPFFGITKKQAFLAWSEVARRIKAPLISLLFAVPMVQIMIISGTNSKDFLSMPLAMAQFMESVFQNAWPVVGTFVGALGAFMSGSTTVSNMLFSLFQYSIADNLGISHIIIVSLQNVGGSFGNMINVQKIITACAVVGLTGVEGLIIKRTIIPMTLAILISGIVGMILIFFIVPGLF